MLREPWATFRHGLDTHVQRPLPELNASISAILNTAYKSSWLKSRRHLIEEAKRILCGGSLAKAHARDA